MGLADKVKQPIDSIAVDKARCSRDAAEMYPRDAAERCTRDGPSARRPSLPSLNASPLPCPPPPPVQPPSPRPPTSSTSLPSPPPHLLPTSSPPAAQVFIGSCTNGRIEDMRAVASVAKGRRVHPSIKEALVVPGSGLVKEQAEEEGLDAILTQAGFEWRQPGCSMCLAMNPDKLPGTF